MPISRHNSTLAVIVCFSVLCSVAALFWVRGLHPDHGAGEIVRSQTSGTGTRPAQDRSSLNQFDVAKGRVKVIDIKAGAYERLLDELSYQSNIRSGVLDFLELQPRQPWGGFSDQWNIPPGMTDFAQPRGGLVR